jgi:superoxide dismutase, Fe-Mn family
MIYELPTLPYDFASLEPYIDAQTMEIHFTKHHAGYIAKLNKSLQGHENLSRMSLEEILADIRVVAEDIRQDVRNNGGGHLNHSLFWHIMGPHKGGMPVGPVADAIASTFGDFLKFQEQFTDAAMSRFGSGWAWLCVNSQGKLEVLSTPNQDSPIMLGYRPVVGIDVWEHAYYLKYQSRRADYISAWWNVVNWPAVSELYQHCLEMVGRMG